MHSKCGFSLCVGVGLEGGLLDDNHGEFSVRGNHDLVHLRANLNEEDFLIRVQQLNGLVGLVLELGDEGAIDDGVLGLHGGPNGDALLVDDDDAEHSLMRVDSIQSFLYFLRGVGRCLCHCCTDISINQNYC